MYTIYVSNTHSSTLAVLFTIPYTALVPKVQRDVRSSAVGGESSLATSDDAPEPAQLRSIVPQSGCIFDVIVVLEFFGSV